MDDFERLLQGFRDDVANIMELLKAGKLTVPEWEAEFAKLIATYHQSALMLGLGRAELTLAEMLYIISIVEAQLEYLSSFALVVQSTPDFIDGWLARADLYAKAIKEPYWKGNVDMLPLPAMPAQGTICLTNCRCAWDIRTLDETAGDYDAYWIRAAEDSCPTCLQREADWSPVRIRGGNLVL